MGSNPRTHHNIFIRVEASRYKDGCVVDMSINGPVHEHKTWFEPTTDVMRARLIGCVKAHDRCVMSRELGLSNDIILYAELPRDISFQRWKMDRLCVLNRAIDRFKVMHILYTDNSMDKLLKRNRRRIRLFKRHHNGISLA